MPTGPVDLSIMPNLRKLSIFHFRSFSMHYTDPMDPSLQLLCQMLDPPNALASVVSLHLQLHFNEVNVREDFLLPKLPNSHWELIDRIITGDRYPNLEDFYLELDSDLIIQRGQGIFEKGRFFRETKEKLLPVFRRINASDRIKFKFTISASV